MSISSVSNNVWDLWTKAASRVTGKDEKDVTAMDKAVAVICLPFPLSFVLTYKDLAAHGSVIGSSSLPSRSQTSNADTKPLTSTVVWQIYVNEEACGKNALSAVCYSGPLDKKDPVDQIKGEVKRLEGIDKKRYAPRDVRSNAGYSLAVAYHKLYKITGDTEQLKNAENALMSIINDPDRSTTSRPVYYYESLLLSAEMSVTRDPAKAKEYCERVLKESPVLARGYRAHAKSILNQIK